MVLRVRVVVQQLNRGYLLFKFSTTDQNWKTHFSYEKARDRILY